MLDEGLKIILNSPSNGHKRRDLPGNMLVYPVDQHLIVYTIEAKEQNGGLLCTGGAAPSRMDFSDRI